MSSKYLREMGGRSTVCQGVAHVGGPTIGTVAAGSDMKIVRELMVSMRNRRRNAKFGKGMLWDCMLSSSKDRSRPGQPYGTGYRDRKN